MPTGKQSHSTHFVGLMIKLTKKKDSLSVGVLMLLTNLLPTIKDTGKNNTGNLSNI